VSSDQCFYQIYSPFFSKIFLCIALYGRFEPCFQPVSSSSLFTVPSDIPRKEPGIMTSSAFPEKAFWGARVIVETPT
jgi:hypothetical protein